jgi:Na+(H+)/acetate symporter ActP
MQFMILFIGVLVYVFYLFNQPPVFHNQVLKDRALQTSESRNILLLETEFSRVHTEKREAVSALVTSIQNEDQPAISKSRDEVLKLQSQETMLRDSVKKTISRAIPGAKTQDRDYMFLNFVLKNLPHGIIGLLLAVMFSAAMSSMAGELNALASTTTVDLYKRSFKKNASDKDTVVASKWFTVIWSVLAIIFAMLASFAENLIQFVNIVGSLFYGTILGIFLAAFYVKRVHGTAVFWSAIIAEIVVMYCYFYTDIAFLLYNIVGCTCVIVLSLVLQLFLPPKIQAGDLTSN